MKIRYFAWVRERVGADEETVALPDTVATAGDLIAWLSTVDDRHASAFAEPDAIRVAIDQVHVEHDEPIAGAAEIAFFPPMTGG
ncbi:molybdopterin converting factor subunit 1 [Polymorphum gilvum]|uniref:Molybdopterin synthase subunit MoaD n=1 Tax=Polymorphum gilvum (strain LMG 25793 / CGMCC 1.9160 / SL003B-26A1) TaxID=991905 RepID=F2J0G9_POLGS|nr:molybdopterin converting factor subunit 1 [Polymorphum gilvum]ADZ69637.1 Molybdopterin synthase subunit MoaD [Polymorphum gilvum SL003B-26A1]